ncbi:MAG: hypothetical protein ACOC8E_07215 [Planctomycetota bacterium]
MFEKVSRDNIEQFVVKEIGRPKWRDARVRVVEVDGRRALLKDVRDRNPVFRFLIGRPLLAREFRFYRQLEGVSGVPRAFRRLDKDGFLAEWISAERPSRRRKREGRTPDDDEYRRWFELLDELHRRGFVHLDLRNMSNFLLGDEGDVYVVDFASALHLPRWLPFRSGLVRFLGSFDRAGVLKMKRRLSPELLSADEAAALSRFEKIRALLLPPVWLSGLFRRLVRRRRRAARRKAD